MDTENILDESNSSDDSQTDLFSQLETAGQLDSWNNTMSQNELEKMLNQALTEAEKDDSTTGRKKAQEEKKVIQIRMIALQKKRPA